MKTMTYKGFIKYNIKHYFIMLLYFVAIVIAINISKQQSNLPLFILGSLCFLLYAFFNFSFSLAVLFALFKKSNKGKESLMDYEYVDRDDFANFFYQKNYKLLRFCMYSLNFVLFLAVCFGFLF